MLAFGNCSRLQKIQTCKIFRSNAFYLGNTKQYTNVRHIVSFSSYDQTKRQLYFHGNDWREEKKRKEREAIHPQSREDFLGEEEGKKLQNKQKKLGEKVPICIQNTHILYNLVFWWYFCMMCKQQQQQNHQFYISSSSSIP